MQTAKIDIETLLCWAFRDELSKKQTSAAEGIWDHILQDGQRGGIDPGHGAAQRYSHFGLPDPDAIAIEEAVGRLEDLVIDWPKSFDTVAHDLSGLITVNDMTRKPSKQRLGKVGWGKSGDKALRAWWGVDGLAEENQRVRDVLMVGGISTKMLITSHAIRGGRPDWREDPPEPRMVAAATGANAAIVGECRGKNLYTTGSYCPLRYEPSPMSIMASRADYLAWHRGLVLLSQTLELKKFIALPPKAPQLPWFENHCETKIVPVIPTAQNRVSDWGTLPLKPTRDRMGPPSRLKKSGPVTYPLASKTA